MLSSFKRAQKKKNNQQDLGSISFVYAQKGKELDAQQNDLIDDANSVLLEDHMPICKDPGANESLLNSFVSKPQYQRSTQRQQISNLEWAAQQNNHQRLVNDLSAESREIKITPHAAELLQKQKLSTIVYLNPVKQQSKFYEWWIIKKLKVIEPSSEKLLFWNVFIGILILGYFYFIIFNMYFSKEDGDQEWYWDQWHVGTYYIANLIVFFIMVIDLLVEFHVAFFEKGSYVTEKSQVYSHYFRNEFIFDFIPIVVLYVSLVSPYFNRFAYIKYFYYLKFYKLHVYDQRLIDRFQLHRKSKASYLIFKMILELLLLMQFFAALFFRVGIYSMDKINEGDESWQSWMDSDNLFGNVYSKPIMSQYYLSVYWSLGTLTTVSYGDITPMNPHEIIVSQCAMIGAIFMFAFNVQTIYEVYQEYQQSKRRFQKHLIAINRFMRDKHISVALQNKIRKYLDHIWEKQRAREQKLEAKIIDQLAPQLKQELLFESYGMDLIQIPWFSNNFSFEFIKQLSEDLKEVYFSTDELIFLDKAKNDDDDALYIIKEGEVELFINNPKKHIRTSTILAKLREGAVFGQYAFITGDGRTCSARSTTYTTLYKVKRGRFLNRLLKFEADYERFCQLKEQVLLGKQLDHLNMECFTCKMTDHTAAECPLTHYTQSSQKLVLGSLIVQQEQMHQNRMWYKRSRRGKQKNVIVKAEEFEDEDNPFVELEQYYQEKQYENQDIDRVQSFHHYYPRSNIDYIHRDQINNLIHFPYFTPKIKTQVVPL